MKTLRMTLMVSFTFAAMMTLAATKQTFELKYLSEVTHGKVIHTISMEASDKNEAIVKAGKRCISDLLDRHVAREDIVDMCNNPRL
jgi:hypothetical protein